MWHVIAYDPSNDLGSLDLNHNWDTALQRATAAQNGLKTAAANSSSLDAVSGLGVHSADQADTVISDAARAALDSAASCFGKLASDLQAQQFSMASAQRDSCIQAYPAVRQQVIQNLLKNSLPDSLLQADRARLLSLLQQLDRQIAQATAAQKPSK